MRTIDVTRRLTPRHRRTRLGPDVGRIAGGYEQRSTRSPNAPKQRQRALAALDACGLVGRSGTVPHHVLRSLAGSDRLSDFDTRTVSIIDLLGELRLDVAADLIMWRCTDGARIATPIPRLLKDGDFTLFLGGHDQTAAPRWSAPLVLRSAQLPDQQDVEVVELTAMTFMQFVGGEG